MVSRFEFGPSAQDLEERRMKAQRRVLGVFNTTLAAALAFLVVPALVGSGQQASAGEPSILVYYDAHMHTTRSDGSGSVADIKATALSRGLSAVIITDHCKSLTVEKWDSLVADTEAASDDSFLALPGFEVTGSDGMFNRDHINALGVDDPFVGDDSSELCPEEVWASPPNPAGTGALYPENLTQWVEYIHSKGGIAVHNHPSGTTSLEYGVDNLGIYNQSHVDDVASYAMQLGYSPQEAWEFGMMLNNLAIEGENDENLHMIIDNPFPPGVFPFPLPPQMPVRNVLYLATLVFSGVGQWLGSPEAPLNSWDDLLMAYVNGVVDTPIFGVANSDAHNTGDPDSDVGLAKNGVYLKKELTATELYKAIKAGRSFATTGPSLALDVNGELMGDTAYVFDGTANVNLSVDSESPTAILVKIDIIRNGELWQTISPWSSSYQDTLVDDGVTEAGYYRVEVTSLDGGHPYFAWSNPVFVRVP
jgi:hypothetical protein